MSTNEEFARKFVRSMNEKKASATPSDDREFKKLYLENLTLKKKVKALEERFSCVDQEIADYKRERDDCLAEVRKLKALIPKEEPYKYPRPWIESHPESAEDNEE